MYMSRRIRAMLVRGFACGVAACGVTLAMAMPAAAAEYEYYGLYPNRTECIKAAQRLAQQSPNLQGYECRGWDNGDPSFALWVNWG